MAENGCTHDFSHCSECCDRECAATERELNKFRTALGKINDIRNSIVGYQTVNFSAHVYPLVAALQEAGIEGEGYDIAHAKACTQIQRIAELESDLDATRLELRNAQDVLTLKTRDADWLADEVAAMVNLHAIDSRSRAADALLDYRNPPQSERSDALSVLQQDLVDAAMLIRRLLHSPGSDNLRSRVIDWLTRKQLGGSIFRLTDGPQPDTPTCEAAPGGTGVGMTHDMQPTTSNDDNQPYWICSRCGIECMWEKSVEGLNAMECNGRLGMAESTPAEIHAMLNRVREHMKETGNCPICAEVDYTDGKPVDDIQKHASWCFWVELLGMEL